MCGRAFALAHCSWNSRAAQPGLPVDLHETAGLDRRAPLNTLGLRSVMFTVESLDDTVARLRANGAELVGEVARYEDQYRLFYMRGPAGIIVALAEELAKPVTP